MGKERRRLDIYGVYRGEGATQIHGLRSRSNPEGFLDRLLEAMEEYRWPGNVRELIHLVERSLLLSTGSTVKISDLPPSFRRQDSTPRPPDAGEPEQADTDTPRCADPGAESVREESRSPARSHSLENDAEALLTQKRPRASRPFREAKAQVVEVFERAFLVTLLRTSRGNTAEAAKRARMSRRSLSEKLKRYGIDRNRFKS